MLMIQREGGESEIGLLPKQLRSAFAAIKIGLVDVDICPCLCQKSSSWLMKQSNI